MVSAQVAFFMNVVNLMIVKRVHNRHEDESQEVHEALVSRLLFFFRVLRVHPKTNTGTLKHWNTLRVRTCCILV